MRSHSLAQLRAARAEGNKLFILDTGEDGEDDVLYGTNQLEVEADIRFYLDNEIPEHWTLREISWQEFVDALNVAEGGKLS